MKLFWIRERRVIIADVFSLVRRFRRSVATNLNVENARSLEELEAGMLIISMATFESIGYA